ncbi:MAG: biotin--[acetyl-CoA-carboxylase] ligase [Alphaproteobacteria bacterium]|jgi:BirA family transcriptional regulator, biotin operon repressor / biotin---[acetyl-CoA-carboxylase] ligase|nr:biotin--[acetyl-CoA-carboxylase] ligase [Alphaproteobacteria bacterium]
MSQLNLPSAYHLVSLDTVDNTNAEARRRAVEGEETTPDGTLIVAKEQTEGRGRRGRTWHSPPGNLYFSLVLRPEIPIARAAEFSFIASLAMHDALGTVGDPGHQVHCKWPNDILLNDHKVAGLLLETETTQSGLPDWIILGIGLNVAVFPGDTEFPATSLRTEGWAATEGDILESFCRHFLKWTNAWLEDGFAPIRKNWLWRCYGKGEEIEVRLENETLNGIFEDIDEGGVLLLKTGDGMRHISAGDVFFPSLMTEEDAS